MAYKNIIFDLGGVILEINMQKALDGFAALGAERSGLLGKADCCRIGFNRCAHVTEKNFTLYNI